MRLSLLHTSLKQQLGGQSVPHLSLAEQTFTLIDGDNKKRVAEMDDDGLIFTKVIIVDGNPFLSKLFYKEAYDPNSEDRVAPTCYSDDGTFPARDATEKQSDSCAGCPKNVWGSKISQSGAKIKACTDVLKLAVIVPGFNKDKPFMFRVPPASLKNFFAYTAKFEDVDMGDRKANVGDFGTVIYFEAGKQGIINFIPYPLEGEEAGLAAKFEDDNDCRMLIGIHNVQVDMPQLEAPKQQKPKLLEKQPPVKHVEVEAPKKEEPKPKSKMNIMDMSGMRTKQSVQPAEPKLAPDAGIPKTNMPSELKGMLGKIMGM